MPGSRGMGEAKIWGGSNPSLDASRNVLLGLRFLRRVARPRARVQRFDDIAAGLSSAGASACRIAAVSISSNVSSPYPSVR
jgi:hypothetical protein